MNRAVRDAWSVVVLLVFRSIDASAGPRTPTGAAPEDATRWFVVQPGYPGSTEDATGFMRLFSGHIAKKAELSNVLGAYHNVPEEALAAFRSSRPAFSLVSLGFYLEHRRTLGLVPLLESQPQDRFVIVALEGTVTGPEALHDAKVAGGPLHERAFLERVVFRGTAPVASWKGEPVLRPSRALRRLDRGTYVAVVLTGREYAAFGTLSRRKKLEKVLESAYYPQTLLVYSTPRRQEKKSSQDGELSGEQRRRLEQVFLSLTKDAEGKALLKTMGIRGFVAVRSEWLKRMEGSFDAEEKK